MWWCCVDGRVKGVVDAMNEWMNEWKDTGSTLSLPELKGVGWTGKNTSKAFFFLSGLEGEMCWSIVMHFLVAVEGTHNTRRKTHLSLYFCSVRPHSFYFSYCWKATDPASRLRTRLISSDIELTFSCETKLEVISTCHGDAASAAAPPAVSSSGTIAENASCCFDNWFS